MRNSLVISRALDAMPDRVTEVEQGALTVSVALVIRYDPRFDFNISANERGKIDIVKIDIL
ncbi:MAG TPA: hypothetical protein VEL08_05980 [Chthoniobacterales bacterium]|nr:hypothetical protein [Chthoniobacterales bacterium]